MFVEGAVATCYLCTSPKSNEFNRCSALPFWFSLFADAGLRRCHPHQLRWLANRPLPVLLLLGLLLPLAGPAFGQATPVPESKRKAKVQARKARVKAILAQPALPDKDTVTIAPKRALPRAKPGQRAGSAPTPPVRNISVDPRDPVGPPPPGSCADKAAKPVSMQRTAPCPSCEARHKDGCKASGEAISSECCMKVPK